MKAYLIDSSARTVIEIEVPADRDHAAVLGYRHLDLFRPVDGESDYMLVDNEGWRKQEKSHFAFDGYSKRDPGRPLGGRALVIGYDPVSGQYGDPVWTLDEVRSRVSFLAPSLIDEARARGWKEDLPWSWFQSDDADEPDTPALR